MAVPVYNWGQAWRGEKPTMKTCGECRMCCKVFPLPILGKAENQWCKFLRLGAVDENYRPLTWTEAEATIQEGSGAHN